MTGEAVIMDNQYGTDRGLHKICYICNKNTKVYIMTQMILNIENPDIIPSLRKVLGQIKGVTVEKTIKAEASEDSHRLQGGNGSTQDWQEVTVS